jgi:hypothetical protein
LLAAIALAAWPAAGAHADVAITTDRTAANVSGHHGQLVWSRVGKDGRARLVRNTGSGNEDVRVPPKSGGLFDPDTGTSHGGHQIIVYTRCAGVSGAGCDVWLYNDGTRREHKVAGASSATCSEYAPSVWIGRVAFARTGPGECPGLYVVRRGRVRRLDTRTPSQTDLRGTRVTYLITAAKRTTIRVRSLYGGQSRRVVSGFAAQKESYRVTSPALDSRYVYWLQEDRIRDEFFSGRGLSARAAPLEFTAQTFPGRVDSIAVRDGLLFYANGRGVFEATNPGFAAHD